MHTREVSRKILKNGVNSQIICYVFQFNKLIARHKGGVKERCTKTKLTLNHRFSRVQLFRCNFYFSHSRLPFFFVIIIHFFRNRIMMQFNEMEIITKRHVLQVSFVLQNGIPSTREQILSR